MSYKTYDNYKDSGIEWIGDIPSDWKIDKIKHQATDKKFSIVDGPFGTQLHNDEYVDDGVPVVRVTNLDYDGCFSSENLVYITEDKYKELKRSSVKEGDFIIAKTGATIGKVGIFQGFSKGVIASSCLKITLNKNICPTFFKYFLISDYCQIQIINESSGSTRDTIGIDQMSNITIFLPEFDNQVKIADYLDKKTSEIDNIIAKNKKLISLLEEKKVALINQIVSKGLDTTCLMKDSGIGWIGDIPENWGTEKLKFCTDMINDKKDIADSKDKFVGLEHIESKTGRLIGFSNEGADGSVNKFKENMVLFGKLRPYLAKVILTSFEGVCSTEILVFQTKRQILPKFLYYVLLSNKFIEHINSSTYGVKMPRASPDFINNTSIMIPPLYDQEMIINFLNEETSKIDKTVEKIQTNTNLLNEYKASLIHHAVTGKIDVRDEV